MADPGEPNSSPTPDVPSGTGEPSPADGADATGRLLRLWSDRRVRGGVGAVLLIAAVAAFLLTGQRGDPDSSADTRTGQQDPDATPTTRPTPTSIPITRPTGADGIEFSGYPFVNDRGTYYSTLGAPWEYTRWVFSERLLWNQQLPDDTPVAPHSDEIAGQIAELVRGERFVDYQSAVETGANAPYVLLVDSAREEFVHVESDCFGNPANGWGWDAVQFEEYINSVYPGRDGIPMPPDFAMDADDSDFAVTIYDYREDILIDFWVFKASNLTGGAPTACWAGVIRDYFATSDGVFPYPVGGSASGLTAAGTIITLEDLRSGSIDHALSVSLVQVLNELHLDRSRPSASWPANRNDGVCADEPNDSWDPGFYESVMAGVERTELCLREGQRLRLPADLDVSTIEHPVARMIAEAARDYGIIVHDYGACFCLQGESGRAITEQGLGADPWLEAYGDLAEWEVMAQVPWELIEVLPTDWGKPDDYLRPCIATYRWVDSDPACERTVEPYEAG